jgi:hypothetical protein
MGESGTKALGGKSETRIQLQQNACVSGPMLSYVEQWRERSKQLRAEAERTYAETSNMMRGIADDYLRLADTAEAIAGIRRVLYYATLNEKAAPERGSQL